MKSNTIITAALIFLIPSLVISQNCENEENLTIKQIVEKYYHAKPLYIGSAGHENQIGKTSGNILDKEFSYVTPANDFKLTVIHPTPNVWSWTKPDAWIKHVEKTGQILRLHSPISPQVSKWVKEDNRTPEELSKMLDEYLIALYLRYASNPAVKWVDVVNETIFHEEKEEPFGRLTLGGWFTHRQGADKWENPWTLLGYDENSEIRPPLYIARAFELAEKYAPNVKFILNQQGQFEPEVWEKVKKLVHYIRDEKRHRIDGIGWQAHVEAGWEKTPGNMRRLAYFIDWCHAQRMEFHITEFNVYTHKSKKAPYTDQEQAETFAQITQLMLSKLNTGVIGINFWNIQDNETGQPEWRGAMWDVNGNPKPAYFRFKETLIRFAKNQ